MAADIANPQIILFLHRSVVPPSFPPLPPFLLGRQKNDTWWGDGQLVSRDTTQVGGLTPAWSGIQRGGKDGGCGVQLHKAAIVQRNNSWGLINLKI